MFMLKDWNYKTFRHVYIESRREQVRLQEELSMKEKVLRDTRIRSMHEMGEESSRTSSSRSLSAKIERTIMRQYKKGTSQLQEMQPQMNYVNDSGEFQEVESKYSGKLSYVSSHPAMIPSSRCMLSRDKTLAT